MMSPSPWPLLRTFVAVLAFTNIVSAQLTVTGPKYPEANVNFYLTWSGGTPPYTVYVLTPDLTKYYYKYVGSNLSTTYDFALSVGTEVAYQCRDSGELIATTPTVTVIATLYLQPPNDPQTGVQTNIQWGGGLSPYTVYVLTSDQTKYYWKYTGSGTNQEWTPDMAAGTEVVFRVIDLNGVKVTSDIVTVQANAALSSDSVLSVLSTMSVASVNSVHSIHSITSSGGTNGPSRRANTTTSGNPSRPTGDSGGGGKKTNTAAIAGGVAGGVAGLVLVGALGFFIAHRGGMGHSDTRMVDNSRAGFHDGGGQGGQAAKRETALLDIGGDLGAGSSIGGANAGSGVGAGGSGSGSGSAGAAARGAAFQGGAQGDIHGAGVGEVPPTPDVQMQYITTPAAPVQRQLQPQVHNGPMSPVGPQGNQAMGYSGMPEV